MSKVRKRSQESKQLYISTLIQIWYDDNDNDDDDNNNNNNNDWQLELHLYTLPTRLNMGKMVQDQCKMKSFLCSRFWWWWVSTGIMDWPLWSISWKETIHFIEWHVNNSSPIRLGLGATLVGMVGKANLPERNCFQLDSLLIWFDILDEIEHVVIAVPEHNCSCMQHIGALANVITNGQ